MANHAQKKTEKVTESSTSSPWAIVSRETSQSWEMRKNLIMAIEKQLNAKVIVYFTSFYRRDAQIVDGDAEMIENILSTEHSGGKLVLIINSAGGSGMAAERIVNICRAYSNNQFEVIVPHMAKSAATLICFGASRIHMSPTAELGPVDPQVKYLNEAKPEPKTDDDLDWISAEEYVRSYDNLMNLAISGKAKRLEPILQQLMRYDARYIEQLKSAQALSEKISIKLLKSGMMSKFSEKAIRQKMSNFLIQKQTAAHGRMISMSEAKKSGLNISEIKLQSDLWKFVWELFIRGDWAVSMTPARKILESSKTGLRGA